jgi:gliding motility-associated-like protein
MSHQIKITLLFLSITTVLLAQDVSLYQQFNGRYDYTAFGNTMNIVENGPGTVCDILTSSSADFYLDPSSTIQAAYLYWAGTGADGDLAIELNGNEVNAERTWSDTLGASRSFFAAFADVTDIVTTIGSGTYTVSELDLYAVIQTSSYCATGTNFAGWAITVVYQNDVLPLNQVNVYDGLQSVPNELEIVLDNLNVFDNIGAKIGFVAWEGDSALAVNESLRINGNLIANPPLNPGTNAFNGTNSFTGLAGMHNMDIDFYSIQNNIDIGDTSATISLTSGQDFVMINNIITVLNSQLPDAVPFIEDFSISCNSREILLEYTITNTNSTALLPANTPISFYANTTLIALSTTQNDIPIGGSESGNVLLTIPDSLGDNFTVFVVADDDGSGLGIVNETNETNNSTATAITLLPLPEINDIAPITACDLGNNIAEFDLTSIEDQIASDTNLIYTYYQTETDAINQVNEINIPTNYSNTSNPETIYVFIDNAICFEIVSFELVVENCLPDLIPNGVSPNGDGLNDLFDIPGLHGVFENMEMKIFDRYGVQIFQGDYLRPWDGKANKGINSKGELLPVGTYFYVIILHDPNFPDPITGWVYLNY